MTDVSVLGRCAVCNEQLTLEDEGDSIVVLEDNVPDVDGITIQDVREGVAAALRRYDGSANQALARAYEEFDREIVLHDSCHDQTALDQLYADVADSQP